jgi:hypothetical protein
MMISYHMLIVTGFVMCGASAGRFRLCSSLFTMTTPVDLSTLEVSPLSTSSIIVVNGAPIGVAMESKFLLYLNGTGIWNERYRNLNHSREPSQF